MNVIFKKENLKKTIFCILYLVFGLMICILPSRMFNFVETALCIILIFAGIFCILVYSLMPSDAKMFKMLIYGIVSLGFGFLMLFVAKFFAIFLSALIGINGVILIIDAMKEKKQIKQGWIASFVIGIVVTVFALAVMILSGTSVSRNLLAVFFGIIFLINGIYLAVDLGIIISKSSKIANTEQEKIEVDGKVIDQITNSEEISKVQEK